MKILIWQSAYLGDVVLTTPLIMTLKRHFPSSQVAFAGRSFIRELLKGLDVELITFDKGFWESFEVIEKLREYHIAISPHISARSALILFMAGVPTRIGFDRSELKWLYTHTVKHRWGIHEVDRNLELLKPLGIREFERMPYLFVSEEEEKRAKDKFRLPESFAVLSPFSNFRLKEWNIDRWLELSKRLSITPVIVGADTQRANIFDKVEGINLIGKTSLRELMAVISLSKVVISCDSAPVHIANALGVPALSVYTATSPDYGFYPLIGDYVKPELYCSPCSPNPKVCRTGTQACLSMVGVGDVLKGLERLLS
ncbi:glycosyltransferase family 9 protein [Hydrogenobacter sp. T-2]|uniref:glycosyltransferase family 9 protein n=1 Tax=Pampinifervens diazotrophicum TaxID=1632018 RepID=UPI002B25D8FC|nr:glycosyltransferase family 9 protein [Hydrogenobacter sp. T-2]WPM31770.1 glycosyltransferase family 9 protein [Hydrogenobacter sp. T-2]